MKDLLYLREKSLKEIIELIFQTYIDSYSDPHEVLKKNSFGRAHHRLLCIIEGNPNISIADILRKLKIYFCTFFIFYDGSLPTLGTWVVARRTIPYK